MDSLTWGFPQYGKEYTSQNPAAYGSTPTTSFQLAVRTLVSSAVLGGESFAQSEGMTHHVCRSLPEYNARRILKLKPRAKGATGEGGNHEGESFPSLSSFKALT